MQLPAGADLDSAAAGPLMRLGTVRMREGWLTIALYPLPPGARREIPLPIRFQVPGTLRGYGVTATLLERPGAEAVLPSRAVRVTEGEVQ